MATIELSERELFALCASKIGSRYKRHKFGVEGLFEKIYEQSKKFLGEESYKVLKKEWQSIHVPKEGLPVCSLCKKEYKKNSPSRTINKNPTRKVQTRVWTS